MEFFNLRLSDPGNEENGIFWIQANSNSGQTQIIQSKLPFFKNKKQWRTTIIKILGASEYQHSDFPLKEERDWMIDNKLLDANEKDFSSHVFMIIGKAIFNSLFPDGEIRQLLDRTIAATSTQSSLLIQLEFNKNIKPSSRLPDYPWELAADEQGFLSRRKIIFSRYLAFLGTEPKLPPVEKVNILLVSSNAYDERLQFKPLDNSEHIAVLESLQFDQADAKTRVTDLRENGKRATFRELCSYLNTSSEESRPHIIHFNGHGFFGKYCERCRTPSYEIKLDFCRTCNKELPIEPQGYLLFDAENEKHNADYVSAEELGQLLLNSGLDKSDESSLRLMVTSACKSGLALLGEQAFNGVAQSLIKYGIPAVVAMQYNVTVQSAREFSQQFYQSIGAGQPVALALHIAKGLIRSEWNQWYRPILYLRWQDNKGGELFAPPANLIGEDNLLTLGQRDTSFFSSPFSILLHEASRIIANIHQNNKIQIDYSLINSIKKGIKFIQDANREFEKLELNAKTLISKTQSNLTEKLEELKNNPNADPEEIRDYEKTLMQISTLLESVEFGKRGSNWLQEHSKKLVNDSAEQALQGYRRISRDTEDDFKFDIKTYIRLICEALDWADTEILDEIHLIDFVVDIECYNIALRYIKDRVNLSSLPERTKIQAGEYFNYLLERL